MKTFLITSLFSAFLVFSFSVKGVKHQSELVEVPDIVFSPIFLNDGDVFDGGGKTITLSSGANCPVIVIGGQGESPTRTSNVVVRNVTIDGNRQNQSQEIWSGGFIRNNGITVRNGFHVTIDNVIVKNCRSGGIVLEKGSSKVTVTNSTMENNEFDGLAAYETTNCFFSKLNLKNNQFAGASFDLGFNKNLVTNVKAVGNKQQGIFMRHSNENIFQNIKIKGSEFGIFIAESELKDSAAKDNSFYDITFLENGEDSRINNASCLNNDILESMFVNE